MNGQLCTCDVENYGDLLYPIIFKMLTKKHGIDSDFLPLGFIKGPAPCSANYTVHNINEVIKSSLSHLVIGGGDILRTDVLGIARPYSYIYKQKLSNQILNQLKKVFFGKQYLTEEFVKLYMGYSSIAPFILNKTHFSTIGSIVYCSCGVPFIFPAEKSHAIRKAFETASFIYLRDTLSRDKLRAIGVRRHIEVAPDMIVTLSDFFDLKEEQAKGHTLLDKYGVNISKEIICFQSCPQRTNLDEILLQLTKLKDKTGAEVVLLPIGYAQKDHLFLQRLAKRSRGSLKYIGTQSIFDVISVLATCNSFIGTSMHGNITAFSFGIPHLFGPIGVDKVEGFLKVVGLGMDFKLGSWSELVDKHTMITSLPRDYFATKAEVAKKNVYVTLAKVFEILNR
jgi:hypothetical protein